MVSGGPSVLQFVDSGPKSMLGCSTFREVSFARGSRLNDGHPQKF